ncbi:hypothetical protein SAMN05518672_106143 [Chitinophaga sp. CF118]|uniref:hypothetical protein n=1 Tax=Chitinophaga sp. CF118 TaxID=1884367 RepID=UPI0008F0AB4E|nr:hypothetical protein [Chitinophaga sp. CF118]SFE44384.1 hypothetical protein SAMN05518672_106143 [Chitinophaga sp. CF118]
MSLLSNNKKAGKKATQTKPNMPGANPNSFMQSSKNASFTKKPIKTGGTRGS